MTSDDEVRSSTHPALRRVLVWAMGLFAVAYVVALPLLRVEWSPATQGWLSTVVDGLLGMLTVWAPAAVCWLAVSRVGFRRPEVLLATAAVTAYAAGDTYYRVMTASGGPVPFPRWRTWGTWRSIRCCWQRCWWRYVVTCGG